MGIATRQSPAVLGKQGDGFPVVSTNNFLNRASRMLAFIGDFHAIEN
jgi:hypothetical protein